MLSRTPPPPPLAAGGQLRYHSGRCLSATWMCNIGSNIGQCWGQCWGTQCCRQNTLDSNVNNIGQCWANVKTVNFDHWVQCCQHWPMLGPMFGQHTASQGGGGGKNSANTRWINDKRMTNTTINNDSQRRGPVPVHAWTETFGQHWPNQISGKIWWNVQSVVLQIVWTKLNEFLKTFMSTLADSLGHGIQWCQHG